jgi:hypothetical protein
MDDTHLVEVIVAMNPLSIIAILLCSLNTLITSHLDSSSANLE